MTLKRIHAAIFENESDFTLNRTLRYTHCHFINCTLFAHSDWIGSLEHCTFVNCTVIERRSFQTTGELDILVDFTYLITTPAAGGNNNVRFSCDQDAIKKIGQRIFMRCMGDEKTRANMQRFQRSA